MRKILLSAYACHPEDVSEPGVAWRQVASLVKRGRFNITLLTRSKNVGPIRDALRFEGYEANVIGIDLPGWARFWKRGHLTRHIYYYIWQLIAYRVAQRLDREVSFDVVHHISFMSVRTNMVPFLRPPSIVGPVGGAQLPPKGFGSILRDPIKERLRTFTIFMMRISPLWRSFVAKANLIILANRDNLWIIPEHKRFKCVVRQIGWSDDSNPHEMVSRRNNSSTDKTIRLYWGGRLVGWKGLEILLRALSHVRNKDVDFFLNITGKGPNEAYYKQLVKDIDLAKFVRFHDWIGFDHVHEMQAAADIYVFTSLHETTGTALMEMMAMGKPIVVIDHAGPGEIISDECAMKVPVNSGVDAAIRSCADHIVTLSRDPELRQHFGYAAKERLSTVYSWDAYMDFVEKQYAELAAL